ncbi:choice-of-anchor G family protein [Clavibacter phaseoli]|nr:choice-of-anchor G family protein [Clavibacter phaseoli]
MPSRRSRLATATAFGLAAAIVAFGGTAPANAAAGDTAEAEGRLLTLRALNPVVDVPGAYTAYAPNDTPDPEVLAAPISADVLQGLVDVQVGGGVNLGQVLNLGGAVQAGAVQQYASSGSAGATAGAGLLAQDGGIAVNGGAGQLTTLDLGPTLAALGLGGTVSDLDLRFGALSASATDPGAGATSSAYRIASADGTITSPLVGDIAGELQEALAGLEVQLEGGVDTGAITGPALQGILRQLTGLGATSVGAATATVDATVDTDGIVQAVLAQPLTSGGVTIDFSTGAITLDLDQIQQLNGLGANTSILTGAVISDAIDTALTDIIAEQLPALLLEEVLDSTTVTIAVSAPLTATVPVVGTTNAGTLGIDLSTTLRGLVAGGPGDVDVDVTRTNLLLLPVGPLLQPLTTLLTAQLVPALLSANTDVPVLSIIAGDLTAATDAIVGVLDPVFPVLDRVVRLTANAQDAPGDFVDPDGLDAGSFSVSALRVSLLPGTGPTVDLATATVRAVAVPTATPVLISSPTPGQVIDLAAGETTIVVPIVGTADPDGAVTLTLNGQTVGPVEVGTDGRFTLTPDALPAGTYTATVTQTVPGELAGPPGTVTFTIAPAAADITITTPTPGQVFLTTPTDPTVDVPVRGAADERATVTVTIDGQAPQTDVVGADGLYAVSFADLPVGTYTATATQSIDGVARGTDTVTFTVGAPAAEVTITAPRDGDQILSAGTVPTADVPVTGAADPRASVTVTIPGQDPRTELVGDDGTYDVLFADLPVGDYTATATQTIGGIPSGTATVDFSVVAPAVAPVIDTPTDGQDFVVPVGGTSVPVTVSGSADPRGSVLIAVTGQTPVTQVVGDDGRFEATFPGLTAAGYTVTVTQTIGDTPAGSDTADFTVSVAGVDQVVILTPDDGDFFPLPDGDTTTTVPVTGTADPDATVTLTVGGTTTAPVDVDDDGGFELATPALPSGTYTGTVTQTIGGVDVGTDTVTFTVGVPVVIESPFDFQVFPLDGGATTRDVPISGTADPLGTVTVSIVGLDPITTEVDAEGNYSVTFFGLERGSYEAIATQTIGGAPAGDDTVEFDVGVDGEEGTDSDAVAAIDVDGDGTDGTDGGVDADGGTDADAVDADGAADAAGTDATDAAGTDATDAAGTDATDAAGADATDAAGTDATDAAGTDATDAAGTDATDAAGTDATDAAGTDATDAAGADATDAAGADATDAAGTDATDAAGTDATDAAGTDATDAAGTDATDAAGTDATDAAGTDATDAAGTDATDAAGTDATDAAGTDAAGTDATDAAGTDATDAAGTDATDAAGTDATDAAGTDATDAAGTDATDAAGTDATDAAGTDATDAAGTDATDAAGTDATDAAGTDATDAAGTDATDAAGTDATDAAGTDATDAAGTDATDAAGTDATDAAGTDATDAAGTDATDAAGTDATDAAGTDATDAAGADAADAAGTDATDAAGADAADAAGADAADAAGTDATDAAGTDATDAAGTDATDAAGTDATDAAGTDATDAAGTDATDAAGTDATDAAGTDATDAAGTDATDAAGTDATDAAGTDATDAAGTDAADAADATDGSTDGADAPTRAVVRFTEIVRGSGSMQMVDAVNFIPGETLNATVNSTPMPLAPLVADADGRALFTFEVGPDFELGNHSVTVVGSQSGMADEMITQFRVVGSTVPAGQPGTPIGGGANGGYGGGILPVTGGDADGMLLLGGIALLMMLTGAGALHRGRSRRA